jgi:hypothetical protein
MVRFGFVVAFSLLLSACFHAPHGYSVGHASVGSSVSFKHGGHSRLHSRGINRHHGHGFRSRGFGQKISHHGRHYGHNRGGHK